jgi:hypothetical protein
MLGASIPAKKLQLTFTTAELLFSLIIFQISKLRERARALSRLKEFFRRVGVSPTHCFQLGDGGTPST